MIVRHIYLEQQPSGLRKQFSSALFPAPTVTIDSLPWLHRKAAVVPDDFPAAAGSRWTPQISYVADQLPWLHRRGAITPDDESFRKTVWGPQLTAVVAAVVDSLPWRAIVRGLPADDLQPLRQTIWGPQLTAVVAAAVDSLPWRRRVAAAVDDQPEALRRVGWIPQVSYAYDSLPWLHRIGTIAAEDAQPGKVPHWNPWLTTVPVPPSNDQLQWRPVFRDIGEYPPLPPRSRPWEPSFASIRPIPPFVRQPEVYGSAAPGFLGGTSGSPGFIEPAGTAGQPGTFNPATTIGSPGFFTPDD